MKLKEKYSKKINISFSDNIIDEIIKLSDYKDMGARKLEKLIKDKIENLIIDKAILNKKRINIKNIKEMIR